MTDKKIVPTTAGSQQEAQRIAHTLVDRRLAACVNIVPQLRSIYRWQNKVEDAQEWLLLIKTTNQAFGRVRDTIRELHSYELPECVSVSVEDGSGAYLDWISESVD